MCVWKVFVINFMLQPKNIIFLLNASAIEMLCFYIL